MASGWSLRQRLVAGILVLLMMATLAIGVLSVFFVRANLVAQLDDELRITTSRLERIAAPGRGPASSFEGPGLPLGSLIGVVQSDGSAVAAYLDDNAIVRELSPLQVRALAAHSPGEHYTVSLPSGLGEFRVLAKAIDSESVLIVGISMREVTTTVARLGAVIAAILGGILIVAAVLGREVVRLGLRPLTRVREAATAVTALPLDRGTAALDTDPSTEVGQLGAAFTRMLKHVQSAFDAREASEQKVRQFVADASHELRTPLAAIRGYSELTRRSGHELPDDIRHALSRIESESVRMSGLVDDLLLLARLDEGRELRHDPVDLASVVADALADARATSPAHDWVERLPSRPVVVAGDQHRLHQVVANLLANARIHTPEGTRVTAALGVLERRAIITITDTGPGIPPDVQPVLFERFARADTSRSRATGSTGLGLAIVSAVVQAHDGEVTFSSRPGETVFRVSLPLGRPDGRQTPASPAAAAASSA